jgi:hypothetical protein
VGFFGERASPNGENHVLIKMSLGFHLFTVIAPVDFSSCLALAGIHCFSFGYNNFKDLNNVNTATWNITTFKSNYRIDSFTDEFRRFKLGLLGVSETHIPVIGNIKFGNI